MDFIGKKVTHKTFGEGTVTKHEEDSLEVSFGTEIKFFIFPDAFEKFLTLSDPTEAQQFHDLTVAKEQIMQAEQLKAQEEATLRRTKQERQVTKEKLLSTYKVHPKSQVVFRCDATEQKEIFTTWTMFAGTIKSGVHKGEPSKLIRLYPNSAVLLTALAYGRPEEERRIIGAYMVPANYIGKFATNGAIPSHESYKLQLSTEASEQLLFWNYYTSDKGNGKATWNSGKHRYFDNEWMAQILADAEYFEKTSEQKEQAAKFLAYFCKLNELHPPKSTKNQPQLTL